MKTKAPFFLYVVALLSIALGILEATARFRYQKSYLAVNVKKHPVFHHLFPPYTKGRMDSEGDFHGAYVTNNRGMRGPGDYEYSKPPGEFRIAVMGDSFTFGVGVEAEETYSFLLQKRLDSERGKRRVLNFGMPSFSPVLEYLYLKKEVMRYQPNLVVLALDSGDIHDDYFYERCLVRDQNGEILACDPFIRDGRPNLWARLKERSTLLTLLDDKYFQSIRKMRAIGFGRYFQNKRRHVRNKTAILTDPDLDNVEFDRFIFTREGKNPSIVSKHWNRTVEYLLMIKEFCSRHGIRFLLTAYPCGQDVDGNQWAKGREYWGFKAGRRYDPSRAFQLIRDFAAENGIDYVSLLEPLRAHEDKILYYNNDGHWTPEGHEAVAQALLESGPFRRLAQLTADTESP